MNRYPEPNGAGHPMVRMDTGIDVLEKWAGDATEQAKDAVYAALFAMADRSLLRTYRVVDDGLELTEFFVLLADGLVIKMRVHSFDSFGLTYIGPREGASGLAGNHGTGLAA